MAQIHQTSIKLQILRGRLLLKLRKTKKTWIKPSHFPPTQSLIGGRQIIHGEMIPIHSETGQFVGLFKSLIRDWSVKPDM